MAKLTFTDGNVVEGDAKEIKEILSSISVPKVSANAGKKCIECGAHKARKEFSINRAIKDGLHSRCKSCDTEYQRRWRKNKKARARYAEKKAASKGWENAFS